MKLCFTALISLFLLPCASLHAAEDLPEPPTNWKYPPEIAEARVEVYREVGDVKLNAWIFEPQGHTANDRRPAVVFFFGGGWQGGTPGQFLPQALHLAQRGLVAISVDYRVKKRQGVLPQDCVRDAKAAIRWVRANASRLGIDPDRIAAAGGSAGGHLAAAVALVPGFEEEKPAISSMPNALVLYNPAVVLAPVEGQPDLLPAKKVDDIRKLTNGQAQELSPYHFVRGGMPPCIIFHGTNDEAVPFPTVVAFQKAMAAAGNRCELKAFEGQPHGFFNPGRGQGEARAEATRNYYRTLRELDLFLESIGYLKRASLPNILLIVADDLGWSDVGWHGGFGKTPVMDQLVREGIELDQHYVQPVCTPTRAALMSGRYPGRFGPQVLSPSNLRAMPLGTVTLASALKSLGYNTHQSGKWHLGARPEWIPNAYGFDTSYGTLTGAADPWTHKYRTGNPYEDTWHRDGKLFDEAGNATELVAAEALRHIEAKHSPWFVYVPFHAVHTPVDAPDEFKKLYDGVKFHDDPVKHESRLRMAAMVSQIDAKIGQFVAALESTGQRDNTLIIFTSDNGGIESLKNAYVGKVPDSPLNSENDPLRGQKATLYEGGTRVCAFVNWPGKLKPQQFKTPMHCVDWFPTIAELTGYKSADDLKWDGISQWSALAAASPNPTPRNIYIATPGAGSLRFGDWKLIESKQGKLELFNIAADPYEQENLAMREREKVMELKTLLDAEKSKDNRVLPPDLKGLPH